MIGYATNETEEMLPLTLVYATKLLRELANARENKTLDFLASDAKSQVTMKYKHHKDGIIEP